MRMIARRRLHDRRLFHQDRLRLVRIQRSFAFSAKIVIGPELDEMTMVTTQNFPGIHRCQSCRHEFFFGGPEQALLQKTLLLGVPLVLWVLSTVVSSRICGLSTEKYR